MNNTLFKKLIHFGVFGGPAKIHHMFADYRDPESQPPVLSWSELAFAGVAAIAAVACLLFIPDDPRTKR